MKNPIDKIESCPFLVCYYLDHDFLESFVGQDVGRILLQKKTAADVAVDYKRIVVVVDDAVGMKIGLADC